MAKRPNGASPLYAATVLVLRPRGSGSRFEVLLTRRASGMKFQAGLCVFPGGTLEPEDYRERTLQRCVGVAEVQAQAILGREMSPKLALGHWVAGARELFEEVGILLATAPGRDPSLFWGAGKTESLHVKRRMLLERKMDFRQLLESEELFCDVGALSYFCYWLTPEDVPLRFHTRFYLTLLPPGQEPVPDTGEVAESFWLEPEQALADIEESRLPVVFPTFACLRTLADFDSLERVCNEYGLRPRDA